MKEYDKCYVATLVVLFTGILYFFTKFIIEKYFLTQADVINPITSEELTNLGISPNLEEISNDELESMWNDP